MSEGTPIPEEEDRTCRRCGETKPAAAFHRRGSGRRNPCAQCISETRPREPNRPKATSEENHRYQLARYGITPTQYAKMAEAQGHVCAICNQPQAGKLRLAVDHCHKTGRVRALLCAICNGGLGFYEKHRTQTEAFQRYLDRYGEGNPLIGYEVG